jgi:hypothetical protein
MKKIFVFSTILLFSFFYSMAQEKHLQKPKINDAWVTLKTHPDIVKGILYQINDSSISISNSILRKNYEMGNFKTSNIEFKDIINIKTRRANSVLKGMLIGAAAGVSIGIFGMSQEDIGEYRLLLTTLISVPMAAIGGGVGALAGSFKISIPIEGSTEDLNKVKGKLNNYAYIKSNSFGNYEHESFIGILQGPSFPLGDFRGKAWSSNLYSVKTGYNSNIINLGYRISPKLGFSVLVFDNQYDVNVKNSQIWWDWSGFLAGPLFTLPLTNRIFFDLKPRIGIANATLALNEENQEMGSGLAVNLSASLRYNFSKRWCILTETGYLSSRQVVSTIGERKLQAYNLCFGIAYRFK